MEIRTYSDKSQVKKFKISRFLYSNPNMRSCEKNSLSGSTDVIQILFLEKLVFFILKQVCKNLSAIKAKSRTQNNHVVLLFSFNNLNLQIPKILITN
jgi:hypothetical protein